MHMNGRDSEPEWETPQSFFSVSARPELKIRGGRRGRGEGQGRAGRREKKKLVQPSIFPHHTAHRVSIFFPLSLPDLKSCKIEIFFLGERMGDGLKIRKEKNLNSGRISIIGFFWGQSIGSEGMTKIQWCSLKKKDARNWQKEEKSQSLSLSPPPFFCHPFQLQSGRKTSGSLRERRG